MSGPKPPPDVLGDAHDATNHALNVNVVAGAAAGGTSSTDDGAFTAGASAGTPMMGYATADAVDAGDVGAVAMLTNRQLKVTLFDSGGSELAVGGGTQYTEDAAAAANPIGNALMLVREDARAGTLTTTDGDNVAARGTNAGELYVKHVDAIPVTDNGGVLTVDGTVAVTNAGLTELAAAIDTELQVDVVGALPAGTNNIGDVDILTIAAGDNNIGNVDVVTLPALPAGNNNIGDVDVASIAAGDAVIGRVKITDGTDVADVLDLGNSNPLTVAIVDGSGDQITSFGGGTQYTEDAAAAANPVGTALTLVRDDARGGSLTTTDGDNVAARGTNAGELYVKHVDSVAVTNAGLTELAAAIDTELQVDVVGALPAGTNNIGDVDVLSVVSGTGATNLGKAIDGIAGATDTGVAILAIRDDALSALTPVEGDWTPLRVGSTGALHVTGGGGGTQYNLDDVASATATGTVALVVRKDSAASLAGTDGDISGLQVDANGALRVTGGGGGTEYTVNAAAPADPTGATFVMERDDALSALTEIEGDWTNPRGSANGALWVAVDGSVAVTNAGLTELAAAIDTELQVDVVGALPAGTNNIGDVDVLSIAAGDNNIGNVDIASIAAGDNNIGNVDLASAIPAGTNNIGDVDVLSVVPGTGATNLGKAIDTALGATDTGVLALAVRDDALATLTEVDNDVTPLRTNSRGATWVVHDGNVTVNAHAVTNAGVFAVQVDGAALTALQLIDNPVLVDDAGFTPASSSVMMAGFEADEGSTDSVDEGDAGAARMTLDRKVIVTDQPHTTGGCSIFRSLDLDETEEDVKTSAGCVYGAWVTNTSTTTRWLKFYNATAANTTVGSTAPVITIGIPGNTADDISGSFNVGGKGITFGTAICVAATTAAADADTGAPAAGDVIVNIFYA